MLSKFYRNWSFENPKCGVSIFPICWGHGVSLRQVSNSFSPVPTFSGTPSCLDLSMSNKLDRRHIYFLPTHPIHPIATALSNKTRAHLRKPRNTIRTQTEPINKNKQEMGSTRTKQAARNLCNNRTAAHPYMY